jgi:hypothetical protein
MAKAKSALREGLEIFVNEGLLPGVAYSIDEDEGSISLSMPENGGEAVSRADAAALRALGWTFRRDGCWSVNGSWEFVNPKGLRCITVDNILIKLGL